MINLLETFIILYETKSFTKTGERLFITQPTVTARIKKLEDDLDINLFLRNDLRTISPTKEAHDFYPKAINILRYWKEIQEEINSGKSKKQTFVLAFSPNASSIFLEPILKIFLKHIDKINIRCHVYDSQTIIRLVETHQVHFGIIERPTKSKKINTFVIGEDNLVWAGYNNSDVFLSLDFNNEPGYYITKFLKEYKYHPDKLISMTDSKMILESLQLGLGSSLISDKIIDDKQIMYKKLGHKFARKFLGIYSMTETSSSQLAIIEMIRTFYSE